MEGLLIVVVVAVVAILVWKSSKGKESEGGTVPTLASYKAQHPSNASKGKVTCYKCGNKRIANRGGVNACQSCGSELFS